VTALNQNGSSNVNVIPLLQFLSPAAPDSVAPHCSETQAETPLADTGSHSEVDCAELKGISMSSSGGLDTWKMNMEGSGSSQYFSVWTHKIKSLTWNA
jgi:hypothetical protein